MKKHISTILLVLALLAGASLLLYPTVSNYWNEKHATQAVATYVQDVAEMDDDQNAAILEEARQYNTALANRENDFLLPEQQQERYHEVLNVTGTGIMGYIEIPEIRVSLPIYHGTEDDVLQIAVGHLDWSSLPVGGEGTHCVLSGHRGLPSASLFTNLDQLVEGDTFVIRVLNEVLTYEVDQILIVEPEDTSALSIEDGLDLCTLVTCTPYGINTHRLLVRGHRVDNAVEAATVRVTSDAVRVEPVLVAPIMALPLLLILLLLLLRSGKKKKTQGGTEHAENP